MVQKLKFTVYDVDNESKMLDDDDLLGTMECTLGQVSYVTFVCIMLHQVYSEYQMWYWWIESLGNQHASITSQQPEADLLSSVKPEQAIVIVILAWWLRHHVPYSTI